MTAATKKIYFPSLNGLRFIAALFVVIHHIEQFKHIFGLENYWGNSFILIMGDLGVTFFFVLSGYLISYLLFVEKDLSNGISLKNFYVRRILRIWPLYYLIVVISLFILPHLQFLYVPGLTDAVKENLLTKSVLFMSVFPNLALVLFPPVPFGSHSWSIGVEEQFYLIWPVFMKYAKRYLRVVLYVIFFYVIIKGVLILCLTFLKAEPVLFGTLKLINEYVGMTRIDCMAIGGIGAYILYKRMPILKILYNRFFQALLYLIVFVFFLRPVYFPWINNEVYSILFCLIILNLSSNEKSFFSLENRLFDYLGRISYGIYMYHPLCLVTAIYLLKTVLKGTNLNHSFVVYFLSIAFTILMSAISYTFFESPFLKLKFAFSKIISGDNAKVKDFKN
ncbi:MAG: hypothetical protein C0392_04460 [Syntrophus sp. (in: bacteria)]|nr:hypothetical protein [Syntrophus sp. (in: bacteria)]